MQNDSTLDLMGRHRQMGVDLFNEVWKYLDREVRTPEENDWMIHAAHASRYHWGLVGRPENLARGEWQISRVYATLGMAESARYHARRTLEICQQHGIGDFDLAFAYEALARAAAVAGDRRGYEQNLGLAREASTGIKDKDDRELLLADLATIALRHG